MDSKTKLQKAKAGLILDQPFWGALAIRTPLVEDQTCKTAWTNGLVIGYNPTFIEALSLDETKGLLAHEVMHIVELHNVRRQDRDPKKWNVACDHAINPILIAAGFTLPKGALSGYTLDDYAELIYKKLPDDPGQGQGKGQGQGSGQGQPGQGDPMAGQGQQDNDPGNCGEVRDLPGKDGKPASEAEKAAAAAQVKVAIKQAATIAKSWGKLPGGVERIVEEALESYVPWQEVLRRFYDQTTCNDYTWMRPNRRYAASGVYLPSLYSQDIKEAAVFIDTSGSIDQDWLNQMAAEMTAIMREVRIPKITVIYCDSHVAGIEEFTPDEEITLHPAGGGGTSFVPPFEKVEELMLDISCAVYLTDGDCNEFPQEPEYPTLWGIFGRQQFDPPFGEVLRIK